MAVNIQLSASLNMRKCNIGLFKTYKKISSVADWNELYSDEYNGKYTNVILTNDIKFDSISESENGCVYQKR